MAEPVPAVTLGNAISSASGYAPQSFGLSRSVSPDVLLLKRPSGFDGVEVWRVRREVEDANAVGSTEACDSAVVVRLQVIHHQDVTSFQLR